MYEAYQNSYTKKPALSTSSAGFERALD